MKDIHFIQQENQDYAKDLLKKYYEKKFIPPDKKNYLTNLRESVGPYMGIAGKNTPAFLLDASSQIATLGFGFNFLGLFGPAHALESWINDKSSLHFKGISKAFHQFIERKMKRDNVFINFCNSGAEANETAFGYCYERRKNPKANTILAFKGSFHGRMMMTLASTWHPEKRENFQWPGFLTEYCPYPELNDDNINRTIPEDWCESWDRASLTTFQPNPTWNKIDKDIKEDVACLMAVREKFLSKNIFAFIIEPMQCEGGDCYSSGRFHKALILMAGSFGILSIYDEVQTCFFLGREFFWHQDLGLNHNDAYDTSPDYITCAKKAQIGIVISKVFHSHENDTFQTASLIRGYYQGLLIDQKKEMILDLENKVRTYLEKLIQKHSSLITRPRVRGLAFAFDLVNENNLSAFVALRFSYALLYYPAGHKTLRFRLNTSFYKQDLKLLFSLLDGICTQLSGHTPNPLPSSVPLKRTPPEFLYKWSIFVLDLKYQTLQGKITTGLNDISHFFKTMTGRELNFLNKENVHQYEEKIMALQKRVYESSRITPIEAYRKVVNSLKGWALVVLEKEDIAAMSFASLITDHPLERGVKLDSFFDSPETAYCVDTTLNPDFNREKLGLSLKYALQSAALVEGIFRLQGRNRQELASSMLNINLSLGAYELQYLKEDYPSFQKYRDTIYYTTQLSWEREPINLSRAIDSPLSSGDLDVDYIKEQMPCLNNKICLSNFVSKRFLELFKDILSLMPSKLRHGYSASGQSECVDKIVKSLWFNSDKTTCRMLTFKEHYFGTGSLLSRSLSCSNDPFFPIDHLPTPTSENYQAILQDVEASLKKHKYLCLWIEPLTQKTMIECPREFLIELKKLTHNYGVKIIYNETASQSYRYDGKHFFVSQDAHLTPDAAMVFTGGQNAMVAICEESFIERPMMLISTWDGDEFALANYKRAVFKIEKEKKDFLRITKDFEKALTLLLKDIYNIDISLKGSRGLIRGTLPRQYAKFFDKTPQGDYLVCAGYDPMKRFINCH